MSHWELHNRAIKPLWSANALWLTLRIPSRTQLITVMSLASKGNCKRLLFDHDTSVYTEIHSLGIITSNRRMSREQNEKFGKLDMSINSLCSQFCLLETE